MSDSTLDRIVKGAPAPNVTPPQVAAAAISREASPSRAEELLESKKPASHASGIDPMSTLPSSPPQIYLNLLILEASLRSQYLTLRARRRQHVFFLTILALWTSYFGYVLFFRPREDGKGVGGSPYWLFDMGAKIFFMGGVLTWVLIWATGQWERGVRWPRRWVGITNRGLRTMNLKVVLLRGPWYQRIASYLALLFPYSSFSRSQGSSFHYIELPEKRVAASSSRYSYRDGHQVRTARLEDVEPGGDYVKILLLPKPFSPEFRENWELYRSEYWETENERRAGLRKVVRKQQRDAAKLQGGWFWWTGWRGWRSNRQTHDLERMFHTSNHQRQVSLRKRRPSIIHKDSHSRSSSRSSITPDLDDARGIGERRGTRKARTSMSGSGRSGRQMLGSVDGRRPSFGDGGAANKRTSMLSNASSSANSEAGDSEKASSLLEEI